MEKVINLKSAAVQAARRKPLKICVVTPELYGWSATSDANQAAYALAQMAAAKGDNVTLLWAPLQVERAKLSQDDETWLVDEFYQNHLIKLAVLDKSDQLLPGLDLAEKASIAIYHHLKANDYDVVYFALEGGLGYYTLLSKECGLGQVSAQVCVLATQPLAWTVEADKELMSSTRQIAVSHMERYCAGAADRLIHTSRYIRKWMKKSGWTLAKKCELLPLALPFSHSTTAPFLDGSDRPVDEIVFVSSFGRRHGYQLFCDAISKLSSSRHSPTITTLGYFDKLGGEHSGGMLLRYARNWPFSVRMLPWISEEDTLRYLAERNCLLVVPALAANQPALLQHCLNAGIPVVATNVGGIPEMIDPAHHKRCLADPTAQSLANKIKSALKKRPKKADPIANGRAAQEAWARHFDRMSAKASSPVPADDTIVRIGRKPSRKPKKSSPLVSIIMAHYDRPHFLRQAVASVEQQDYDNIELIIVDDGSKNPEAHAALDALEKRFRATRPGWKILREPNRYLGAARNAGIKASKGERILFLDDDNALFKSAVSTFVHAMDASGSDICTTFSKLLYDPVIPQSEDQGLIQYFPLGGSLDLALLHNSLGDANAMIRRDVFDRIGYLVEDYGYAAQDWEIFTRALLEGLKLRIIPEPLYWYRSSTESMFRSSSWYDNRMPILDLFKRHDLKGLDHAVHLLISQNVSKGDTEIQFENLWYNISNERHRELAALEPNAEEAISLLAEIASAENRPDTALSLLGQTQRAGFVDRVRQTLGFQTPSQNALVELTAPFSEWMPVPFDRLREFAMPLDGPHLQPTFYVGDDSRLFVEARGASPSVAVLKAGCPAGTLAVTLSAELFEETSRPAEIIVMALAEGQDPAAAVAKASDRPQEGTTGWMRLSRPFAARELSASFAIPSQEDRDLVIALRCDDGSTTANALACIHWINVRKALGPETFRKPRLGPPAHRQRAYVLAEGDFNTAKLLTHYSSERPLLMVDRNRGGLFIRPHVDGPVVVSLDNIVPPFARRIVGSVEIAHDEADDFEFALAVARSDMKLDTGRDLAEQVEVFSGWHRTGQRFVAEELSLNLDSAAKAHLSLVLAVRLPDGSKPDPANAFFRKIVVSWDG